MPSILFIVVHPDLSVSRANRQITEAVSDIPGLRVHDLYAACPDFRIDVEREQGLLRAADLVVFQFPLYWYSSPALLKLWEDLVLTPGFAYGSTGTALHGKSFLLSTTLGSDAEEYQGDSSVENALVPLRRSFEYCGMSYLGTRVLYDIGDPFVGDTLSSEQVGRLDAHAQDMRAFLMEYNKNLSPTL